MPRNEIELLVAQLRGIDAWNAARAASLRAQERVAASREQGAERARRMAALRAQQAAMVARTEQQMRDSARLVAGPAPVRAVVAHRSGWFVECFAGALQERGVHLVDAVSNGAQAVGVVVAEQPDLLVVEDILQLVDGADVIRDVRVFSPSTWIGAQAEDSRQIPALLQAGAHAAWTGRVAPATVGEQVVALSRRHQPAG